MKGLPAVLLLLAATAAAVRADIAQQGGRGYAGDQGGFQAQASRGHQAQAALADEEPYAEEEPIMPPHRQDAEEKPVMPPHRQGKAAVADADAAQVSARAQKAIQAHRAETEGAQAGRGHADKAQQARHSQASHAADDADSGVAKPVVPHAAQGKATEAAAHASAHPHQEAGRSGKATPHTPHPTSNHGKAEAIYWDARRKADALRRTFPAEAFQTRFSNLTDIVRIWDFYSPDYNCPLLKERVGRIGDGGKWVCGMRMLQEMKHCLVYSLGSQGDTSFEDDFLDRTICEVHTFDPFLSTDTEASVQGRPGLQFHAVGVLGSADGRVGTESPEKWQSLESIMLDLQHEWLEVLKIDIEGSEWGLFTDFYSNPGATLPATNLMVEFHMPNTAAEVFAAIDAIQADGFRVFSAEPNYYCLEGACAALMTEIAFVKVSPEGLVCIPHGHATTGEGALSQLPAGCLNPPSRGIITN